jgi:hypothetical protein
VQDTSIKTISIQIPVSSGISLGNADHLVTNKVDAEFIAEMISARSKRYIEKPP